MKDQLIGAESGQRHGRTAFVVGGTVVIDASLFRVLASLLAINSWPYQGLLASAVLAVLVVVVVVGGNPGIAVILNCLDTVAPYSLLSEPRP